MAGKISSSPSPRTLAEAVRSELLEPAATALAGADGVLDSLEGVASLAEPAASLVRAASALTGSSAPTVAEFVNAASERVRTAAAAAAGPDGRLSAADADALPADVRLAFFALRDGAVVAPVPVAARRWSETVLNDVCRAYGLADPAALVARALELYDGDGNGYLKRSELEAAAKVLGGRAAELGLVADIDKTVMPPEVDGVAPAPYPGIATLLRILDSGLDGRGAPGDMHYVTARDPERVVALPAWLGSHGLPAGSIDTGVGTSPWIAEDEKVHDIERVFDAAPEKKFVLFGDSNHRDPWVYARVRAKYPDRVLAIVINDVKAIDPVHLEGMHLVPNYAVAAARLLHAGVLDVASARAVMEAAQIEGLALTDAEISALLES